MQNTTPNSNKVTPAEKNQPQKINTNPNQVVPEEIIGITPEEIEKFENMVKCQENMVKSQDNMVKSQDKKSNLDNGMFNSKTEVEGEIRKKSTLKQSEDPGSLYETQITYKFDEKSEALLDAYILTFPEEIQQELNLIKKNISDHNSPDQKKIIFVFSVLKAEKEIADLLYSLFRTKLFDVCLSSAFIYNNQIREDIRNSQEILSLILKCCISSNFQHIASDLLKISNYYKCDDELIKLCIDNDYFVFLRELLKKTKNYLRDQTKRNYSSHNRFSQMQSYKTQFLQSLSMTIQNVLEKNAVFWQEHERANDHIQKCLLRKEENIATKLLIYYFIKFSKNFIKYTVLDYAIVNECYLFVKKYFDIYPKTRYRIRDFNAINKIVEILDEDEYFLHGIFLLSKVNVRALNEVHVRMIIDRYWLFLRDKLMLITYTLNPILVCVQIIENLKLITKFYANVRIKLKMIIDEFFKLACLIHDQISDEIVFKTILLKVFYPSQLPLIKILYSDKDFYVNLLRSEIISNIVTKLWFCEYNWSFNFLNSSSAFKNLTTHFGNEGTFIDPQAWRFKVSKMITDGKKTPKVDPKRTSLIEKDETKLDYSMKPIGLMVFNKTKNGGYVGIADYEINFDAPFEFYKKTRFSKDVRMTNHVFSYFFFENSPAFKVVIEFLVYMLFFSIIIWNMFELFDLRRYFQKCPEEIMQIADGLLSLKQGGTGTPYFYQVLANYTITNHYPNVTAVFYTWQMLGLDYIGMTQQIMPWYAGNVEYFYDQTDKVWSVVTVFWILNLYFYFAFLQNIFELIFYYIKTKKFVFTGKLIIDSVLTAINIYFYDYFFGKIDNSHLVVQNDLINKFVLLEKVMTFFIFIMWFKFIIFLKLTKRFGIVVKVIENMTIKLGKFMIVLCIVILAFSSVCFYLFDRSDQSEFGTFWITMRTLIKFLFGNVSLDNFTDDRLVAGVVLNIYSFLLFVLLLNLIIAILNSDFFEVSERGSLENANTLYFNYHLRKPDKYYSLLTSIVPPLNFIVLILAPFLLRKRNSKLNRIGCMVGYFFYSIIFMSIYTAVNFAIVFPFCYFRLFFTLIINIIIKRKFYKKGTVIWLLWVFCSPFYMIWIFIVHDLPLFIKSMYYPCTIKDRLDEITMEEIMLIDSQCAELISQGKEFTTHGEMTEAIKEDLERINKKFRRNSLLAQRHKAWSILQTLKGKTAESLGIRGNSTGSITLSTPGLKKQQTMGLGDNVENELNVFVEIDKMEVFSFLRQFNGINGMIDLKRLRFLITQIKLCKKFNLMKISKTKQNKLINVIQVVEMFPVERSVINIMGEQVKNSKIFENVLKKFIC